jgi:exodeoxyribonuclease-3
MRVVSWNVNSFKARQDHVAAWISNEKPDVICLQELKCADFPFEIVAQWGYQIKAVCQKAYNGVALLAKDEIDLHADQLPGANDEANARFMDATINGVRVIGCYMPNGNPLGTEKFDYKLRWLRALLAHCRILRDQRIPFVLMGDFNIIPEPNDCYDPAAWVGDALYQPESRAIYREFLNMGLTDAYRAIHGNKQEFTFWDYQAASFQRNAGIRIDHILLSPTLADKLVSCRIDRTPRGWDKPSDHTPIIADIAA